MGDNRLAKVMAAAAVAGGLACLMAAPASAQSITDRFKSLFGGKSDEEPATNAPAVPQDTGDLTCPPVTVRAGLAPDLAMPKSRSFTCPEGVILTLLDLMSRWTIPRL